MTQSPTASVEPTPSEICERRGIICTVAGTGFSLFDGDGKPALETSFYYPLDVEFDSAGRPLILDWNNIRLRRINDDGTVETIMGLEFEGFPIDGALARDTPLHHASDVETDAEGRMFVADNHAPVVFRVDTDDRVFTVAGTQEFGNDGDGGPAVEAKLTAPFGVVPDAEGGFYVTDTDAHVVRYVDAGGIIDTIAGAGARGYSGDRGLAVEAQLNSPTRVQLGPDGSVYFCDTLNHAIRRVDRSGIITTVAGTGVLGYSGDGGPASEARFNAPYDLRFAPNGDLYVADTGNNAVRRIDVAGDVTTVVGTAVPGFDGDGGDAALCQLDRPSGLRLAEDGALWIADTFNQRVRRIADFLRIARPTPRSTPSPTITGPMSPSPTRTPQGPTRTPTTAPVTPTAGASGRISTIAGTGEPGFSGDGSSAARAQLNLPIDVVRAPSGALVVVDFGNHRLRSINPVTGSISTIAGTGETSGDGALPFPTGVAFERDGGFYVAAWGDHRVWHYPADGPRTVVAGTGASGCSANGRADPLASELSFPRSIALLPNGTRLFSEQGCHRIRQVKIDDLLSTLAGTGTAGYSGDGGPLADATLAALNTDPPTPSFGMALSPEFIPDEVYVADTANHVVREIRLFTDRINTWAGTGAPGFDDGPPSQASFRHPTGVFTTFDHAVWVADSGNHAIRRVDPLGIAVATVAGTGEAGFNGDGLPATASQLNNPSGVFVTNTGEVFVADTGNHRIRRFSYTAR